jgi:hypothetical protein
MQEGLFWQPNLNQRKLKHCLVQVHTATRTMLQSSAAEVLILIVHCPNLTCGILTA